MLVRYFSGQLSENERVAFDAWIAEDPAREAEVRRLRGVWEASAKVSDQIDTEGALAWVKERIGARRLEPHREVAGAHPLARTGIAAAAAWRIAAAIALVVGVGAAWWAVGFRTPESAQRVAMWTYTTARGQHATLTLPDSSKVTLNTETRLEIPATFGRRTRDVYLDGEAYFEVAHDRKRPFRVHAGSAVTEVLGTRFSVRARPGEDAVQVAVAEGRVALQSDGKVGTANDTTRRVVLLRGDLGALASDGQPSVAHGIDVGRVLGWTEGRLAFERMPVPAVLAELGRWFDRDFVLGDSSLAGVRLTTSLRGQSLAEAIAVLDAALDVKAREVGRTVILRRRGRTR